MSVDGVRTWLAPENGHVLKEEPCTVVWSQQLEAGVRAVLKMYRCRPSRTARRERLLGYRVEREYRALCHLTRAGVPCPEPLFWCRGTSERDGCWEILATREIPGAASLATYIGRDDAELDFAGLFRSIRRMHDSGMFHGCLFVSNMLVVPRDDRPSELVIADMPRAVLFPRGIAGTRMALYDLLDLSEILLRRFEVGDGLEAYGLAPGRRREFLRRWPSHVPRSGRRQLLRAEFVVRAALGRVLGGRH